MAFMAGIKRGFGSIFTFFSESWQELRKVKWPGRKELISYTIVVVITVTFITVYFYFLDLLISYVLRLFFE